MISRPMNMFFISGLFLVCAVAVSRPVAAQSTGTVSSPVLNADVTTVSGRAAFAFDNNGNAQDNRLRARALVQHNFTDYFAARINLFGEKLENENFEFDAVGLETRHSFFDESEIGFNFGLGAVYTINDGSKRPDSVAVSLFESKNFGSWEFRSNQAFSHQIGADAADGLNFGLNNQLTYQYADNQRAGIENFSSFGNLTGQSGYSDQSHVIGPVFKGNLFGSVASYEAGYLKGVSDSAPDHTVKFFVSKGF